MPKTVSSRGNLWPVYLNKKTDTIAVEYDRACINNKIHDATQQSFTVYPNKYAHGFVVLCFAVVM